jgi:hypothetical protein
VENLALSESGFLLCLTADGRIEHTITISDVFYFFLGDEQ